MKRTTRHNATCFSNVTYNVSNDSITYLVQLLVLTGTCFCSLKYGISSMAYITHLINYRQINCSLSLKNPNFCNTAAFMNLGHKAFSFWSLVKNVWIQFPQVHFHHFSSQREKVCFGKNFVYESKVRLIWIFVTHF